MSKRIKSCRQLGTGRGEGKGKNERTGLATQKKKPRSTSTRENWDKEHKLRWSSYGQKRVESDENRGGKKRKRSE